MSSFLLVVPKLNNIAEYPSSHMPPHAITLKQLTSLVFQKSPPLETNRQIKESVQLYFIKKNDQHIQTYLVATRENIVSSKTLCEAHIKIFECLIDNVFVMLDERVLHQTVDTAKGTSCAPLNIYFLIYLHEITSQEKRKQLVRSFNFTFLYIDYGISLNIIKMIMFQVEPDIKDTTG